MTDYVKSTSFASKDALATGNPLKIVKGTEIDTEFNNIQTTSVTKADLLSPVFTGTPTAPTASAGTSTTQLATTAFATASISPFTGSMLMWPTATPPAGFLLCNGQTASRTAYAALFAIVGVLFGAGDGSTTFTLPDYRDRMPVGAGTTYSANSSGGSKDAIVVSHAHTASSAGAGGHAHNIAFGYSADHDYFGNGVSSFTANGAGVTQNPYNYSTDGVGDHSHGITVNAAGSSGTNANLPPYLGIFFIIKT